jgi:hypothetical protein
MEKGDKGGSNGILQGLGNACIKELETQDG